MMSSSYPQTKAECLNQGRLFEDPDFPAVDKSLYYSRAPPRPFVWKRPTEIVSNPKLFVGEASRLDVQQGLMGDCWLLAAVASLACHKELLYRVVPLDQSFSDGYAGIFHFQFWQYGEWKDVIIDDRLPTYNDRLVFLHSAESREFWTPLLEKAYAKLMGSYEALKGGSMIEAMEDFTGGVSEIFDFQKGVPNNMFTIMLKASQRCSLMGCSIKAKPNQMEEKLSNGLIMGQAYSITAVKMMDIRTSRSQGRIPMVRVRNPWGNEREWNGAWSDKSQEWNLIAEAERKELGLTFEDDGEFWMTFDDFSKNFQHVEICHLGPDGLSEEVGTSQFTKRWEMNAEHGSWKKRVSAGGSRNYIETFWTNPQYRVTVTDPDDDDDENTGTIIVCLMQKERRKMKEKGLGSLTIGYSIYKMKEDHSGPLDIQFFQYNASTATSLSFINSREVCGRHKLEPGEYCIIPSTFEPQQEGDFLLRIFSEKPNKTNEVDEETGMTDVKPQVEMTEADKKLDESLRLAFSRISGQDKEIDAYELREILNAAYNREFKFDGFSNESARSMVAMMDTDRSGKLGYEEFRKLWNDLRLWKPVFKKFDTDKSGNFNSYEFRRALNSLGFTVSNATFTALVQRYANKDGRIYFDEYILVVVKLKTMIEIFKKQELKSGKAQFTLDEFIHTTLNS